MICIKKFICLLFCIFLFSCGEKNVENPFSQNSSLVGTYVCGESTYSVKVTKKADAVTVELPDGYSITITRDGSKVSFDGIVFESDGCLSKFYPLFEMANGINTSVEKTRITHSDGYIFKDFK